jgi:hypothetical protein
MSYEADEVVGGVIRMHLPSAMFLSVFNTLRNERTTYI